MRNVYPNTLNGGNENAYEFTKDGKELRVECSILTVFDDYFGDRSLKLYFSVAEKIKGYWRKDEKTLGEFDRYTRENYPEEVEIVKKQIANEILKL